MALRPSYYTDYEDTGLEPTIEEIIAQIAPVQTAPVTQPTQSKTDVIDALTKQILAQNTTNWQGGVDAQTAAKDMAKIMADVGITDINQFGIIQKPNVITEVFPDGQGGFTDQNGTPVDANKVTANTYTTGGEAEQQAVSYTAPLTQQVFGNKATGQEVANTYGERQVGNAFGGTYAGEGNTAYRVSFTPSGTPVFSTTAASSSDTKDLMDFALMAGTMFGLPPVIGEALGLTGATAGAVGQGLLTAGTQLGSGASFEDALTAGIKSGAVPIANAALSQIPQFNSLPAPVQASVASAVGNIVANGGELTPAVLLNSIATGLNVANQSNIGALEGLTNSGRTGDDMGGSYEPTEAPVASLPTGTQVAGPMTLSVGGVPIYAESSGASAIRPPAGYEVMSSSLADNKPAGSYYDASVNAWMTPTNEFARVSDLDQILADIETFKSGVNTIDPNVIKNIVDESLSDLPPNLTLDDVTRVLSNQNYATPQDIQSAINSINIPQGLTEQNVQTIVSNALANNPSLTTDQVSQIVNNAVSGIPKGLTADDVTRIIGGQNFATPQDIQTAINSINIPQGLTTNDVQSIVSSALANNPSLTTNDVQSIVNQAISKIPTGLTASDVTNILSGQNFATPEDIQTAINSINIPQGLSEQDVKSIVSNAFASNPSLTSAQVSQIVNTAISQIPSGLTANDVQSIVGKAMAKLPAAPTTQDIINIIGGQGLASTAQLTQQGKDLMAALQAQGIDYNTALNQALQAQGANLGSQISNLSQQTQQQLAQQSAQTQQQFNSLTAAQKAQSDALVSQGASFNTALNQVQSGLGQQIGNVQSNLESQLSAQGKQFMDSLQQQGVDYNTALNKAIQAQASQFTTSINDVINQIGGVQTGLQSQIGNVQSSLEAQLDAQGKQYLEQLQQRGVDYQTALDEAIAQQNAKLGEVQTTFEEQLANANSASAANFAKVMASLTAMQEASKPKTYTYELADPSTWGSPVYNQTTGPVAPIQPLDFGNKEMLRGTQWEKLLSPTYGQIPAPVQFNQPSNMSYNQLMGILGTGRDVLPSQALSINDVISGIQNQYGQAPKGSMG